MAVPLVISAQTTTSGSSLSGTLSPPMVQSIGGLRAFSRYSGTAGGGQVIYSGTGILKTVQFIRRLQSGLVTEFCDFAGTWVSGLAGFIGSSGMNHLGRCPGTYEGAVVVSGQSINTFYDSCKPLQYDVPFFSGLAFSDGSGTNPFTLTYQPTTLT